MSRFIKCDVDGESRTVYQYLSGSQPCEAYRIHEEFGIGEYLCYEYEYGEDDYAQLCYNYIPTRQGAEGDMLILTREDIERLNSCLETLEADGSTEARYIWMIKAIRDFMLKYPHQARFIFNSEF
ncbi:MAG: hypothetical protein KME15_10025 [Drouetiella hepatica Uher 2000/2452]|jgi:hypothetical protein|uniref:Uncharacterized protein n=1 Tax=Drouetiella hepatica Uher 2000/2452 TaxID=904376 RepID=A0A951UM81_9CYAN|nr:hypothetical protein [Drouetiella hepatica Uher 2000/2452]